MLPNQLVYHVTPTRNLPSIRKLGLIPRIGPNSRQLGETQPLIYLFPTRVDVNDALMNWLGDQYDDDEPLSLLTLNVPSSLLSKSTVDYELISTHIINPKYIINIQPC